jgi:glyoxylase-like metal-dependent hydrolase (beta-lactamase superfamily II)
LSDLEFDLSFEPRHGEEVVLAPGLSRITVDNPSAFTFHGTNSYLIGTNTVAVVDPGPISEPHYEALTRAIAGRAVSHILITHTHRDHSPLAQRLKADTGALIVAQGPHRFARELALGEINPLDAAADHDLVPDIALGDDERLAGDGFAVTAIHTPGHTGNHVAFGLEGTGILLSGDHVMAWATSIVAPPDGSMADYMASLDKLAERDDRIYFPGHGGPVANPQSFVRALKAHRKMREMAILHRLRKGDRTIPEIVKVIYRETDPRLHGAAGLSVLAHLEDLVGRGAARSDRPPSLDATYEPA